MTARHRRPSQHRGHERPGSVGWLLLVTLVVVLAACGGETGGSDAGEVVSLKADPLASLEIDGLAQVGSDEVTAGEEITGKPRRAQVVRVFEPTGGASAADGVQALATAATEHGWERVGELRPDGFVAAKTVDGAPATMTVASDPDDDTVRLTLQL